MSLERKEFIKSFAQHALDERISLFLGAGSSCSVGYPSWSKLFTPIMQELDIAESGFTDYYKVAQYYVNKYSKEELYRKLRGGLLGNISESPLLNEALNMGFTSIYTTNFDKTIENYYRKRAIRVNTLDSDKGFASVDLKERINIIKMNGDEDRIAEAVVTQSDYENYADTHKVMLTFFKRELISNTFLFIGYSFTDHLVLDCLSELNRYLGGSSGLHYAIIPDEPNNKVFKYFIEDLETRYHVRVLLAKDINEVPLILATINRYIQQKKVFISGAFSSSDPAIEEFSYSFSCNIAESLLREKYRIVNGIGQRFGTHLIGYASSYLAKQGVQNTERHLIITPFVSNTNKAAFEKKRSREKVIGQCGTAIFVFGDEDKNSVKGISGVMEEFEIACKKHKIIIPIAYDGMISEMIWKIVKENITKYPYLEGKLNNLTNHNSPESISKTVLEILNSAQIAAM